MDNRSSDSAEFSKQALSSQTRRRRPRYPGKYPRRFDQKYKEHNPGLFSNTVQKVLDSGKTPAGTHRPIMVQEILSILAPQRGEFVVDCTLGYGGHARAFLSRIVPGGTLLGLDQDPIELPKTEARLRAEGFGPDVLIVDRTNFAGLSQALARHAGRPADVIVADLGASSMQIDNPVRGFSFKDDGPLDMRMNPARGQTVSSLLAAIGTESLNELLTENADEPFSSRLAIALSGRRFETTQDLVARIRAALVGMNRDEIELSVRRTFQALRIAVNDEFSSLEALLRLLPASLNSGGRVAILSFHSGEDRRVKKAFAAGLRRGVYREISPDVVRPTPAERHDNPRSSPAKLRWALRAGH